MTSPAILAKLNPKNVRFDVGNGGIAELTQTDIAAALSMGKLHRREYLLARAKYCGDSSVVSELESLIWGYITDVSIMQKWSAKSDKAPSYIRRMSVLACAESIDHGRCRKCKGRGNIQGRDASKATALDKIYECPSCSGSGIGKKLSGRAKARFFGMDESTYRNYWASRYDALSDEIAIWDSAIYQAINRQFSDER